MTTYHPIATFALVTVGFLLAPPPTAPKLEAQDTVVANPVLRGSVVDADTNSPLACRLYVSKLDESQWCFARSTDPQGEAIPYDRASGASVERHVTLSAHPFEVALPAAGTYRITVERGKEYEPQSLEVEVTNRPAPITIRLRRWIDMPARGWYSGDTHLHRPLADVPNLLRAEDLHAVYPMSQWITRAHERPGAGTIDPKLADFRPVQVEPNRFYSPLNSEYEIFAVDSKRHTLGAVLVLGQSRPLEMGIPPLRAVAAAARAQDALLDLEKHSWAWTPVIAPVMQVDLYPLSNNHVWRVPFAFGQWTLENNWRENPRIETNERGFTEQGWLHYGWEQYYAMLNCGLRMRPTAGTGNGVHPVPAGFSRVYVRMGKEPMTLAGWQKKLNEGRSFVTTGPMLDLFLDDQPLGGPVEQTAPAKPDSPVSRRLHGEILSAQPLDRIEIIEQGEVIATIKPQNEKPARSYRTQVDHPFTTTRSTWIAVRCFEKLPSGRSRFAHSSPAYFDLPNSRVTPRRDQVHYLLQRCETEIDRNRQILSDEELGEFQSAADFYRKQLPTAR